MAERGQGRGARQVPGLRLHGQLPRPGRTSSPAPAWAPKTYAAAENPPLGSWGGGGGERDREDRRRDVGGPQAGPRHPAPGPRGAWAWATSRTTSTSPSPMAGRSPPRAASPCTSPIATICTAGGPAAAGSLFAQAERSSTCASPPVSASSSTPTTPSGSPPAKVDFLKVDAPGVWWQDYVYERPLPKEAASS